MSRPNWLHMTPADFDTDTELALFEATKDTPDPDPCGTGDLLEDL